MKTILIVIAILTIAWIAWGYFSEVNIEMPDYEVIKVEDGYEIRKYSGYLSATTEVEAESWNQASNIAFNRLAAFIFGENTSPTNNKKNQSISMTAPVIVEEESNTPIAMTAPVIFEEDSSTPIAMTAPVIFEEGQQRKFKMTFTMPSKFTAETLPKPKNNLIKIVKVPPYKVAALKFSGFYSENTINKKKKELLEKVKKDNYQTIESPSFAGYNAPWTPPFMRRNEVWIKIQ